MEKLHGPGATSDAKEYQNDHTKSNSDALTIGLAEEHSETPGMMIYDENDPKVPLPIVPVEHQLGPSNQPERDTDKTFGTGIFKELMSLIRRITSNTPTSIESSNLPVVVDTTDDPETLMELNSARLDENLRMRLQILLHRCLQLVIHNQLPLNKAAALALSLKPGSLSLQRYTVSWKPSDISCYIEYAYRYEDTKITKTWLTMASSHLLDAPEEIAQLLYTGYVKKQSAEENTTLSHDLENAKANLRGNIHVTSDGANDDWLAIACNAARHKALVRVTKEAITKLCATGFTRADLTLEKLSEFALNINTAKLDLPTLVEYINSLPPIMEFQSLASTAVHSDGRDTQSLSDPVTHTAKRRNERKLKKKQAQQHMAQVINTSQTEAMSNSSVIPNSTILTSVDQDKPISLGAVLDDHTNTVEQTSSSTKKKNKRKKKDKTGCSQPLAGDHEEAVETSNPILGDQKQVVETADSHQMPKDHDKAVETAEPQQISEDNQEIMKTADPMPGDHEVFVEPAEPQPQYPVSPLAEPSLVAMRNSPTTYAHCSVQCPIEHRKIKSGTELELQKLELPSEHLVEAKERLFSEPPPLSPEKVRDHNHEIEHHADELEEENSMKTREIAGIVRERSRSGEAEVLTHLNDQTSLPEDRRATATEKTILVNSGQQVSDLALPSTPLTGLLALPVVTRRQSMRRIISSSPLPTIHESCHENTRPPSAEDIALHSRLIHRRYHSEPLHTCKTRVDSGNSAPLGGHDDNEDLSDDEAEDSQQSRYNGASSTTLRLREQHPYTPWTTSLEWKYYSNDQERRAIPPGMRAYRFPHPVKSSGGNFRAGDMSDCPVYLSPNFTDNPLPTVDYDEEIDRYQITPHSRPWRGDLRSDINHPDYLPPGKLCQFQALEYAGFVVWRHDRDPFYCKLPSCGKMTLDHDIATMICHGCGTKSRVRYCSKAHLIRDIPNHWKICGTPEEVFAQPIDPGSQPDRFYRRYPAIADVDEDPVMTTDFKKRSFQKHRQQTFAIFNKGQYTLFLGGSTQQVVEWPEDVAKVYKPRVERLLNMAFFRQANLGVIEYLFNLLRYCLRLQDNWTDTTERILKIQFKLEFNYDTGLGSSEDPCECVWTGAPALDKECTPKCKAEFFDKFGLMFGHGLKAHLERWEAKHWPLRIWQRQHPTIRGWEYRLRGEGFPGVPEYQKLESGYVPVFGKGWEGYGAFYSHPCGTWILDE